MPEGKSEAFVTEGVKGAKSLQTLLGLAGKPYARRSWTIRLRSDPNNGSNVKVGRANAVEVVPPGDSVDFDFAALTNIYVDDLGVSGLIIYVDDSGPLDPGDLGL
ncbi:MAG: hypothetical protein L3K23_10675 [Thermoplasmata archaeon]|nr:hypothetical protein [Thermoplasmata archaeon]